MQPLKINEHRYIYTVSELNRQIRTILEDSFPVIWVEGEVSNLKRPSSGHLYFTLKDENAQLRTVLFKNNQGKLKFELEDGQKIICGGSVTVYEKQGEYQLLVEKIEPLGIGALQLALEQLKERLMKEGLFDPLHKRALPSMPCHIGIVTSPTGAAIRDILKVIRRRFFNIEISINPVRVQGEGAAQEIARAIEEFNELGDIDVLIVGRGGGSLEDLWAFNEEPVARAIYNSKIPVISAVGHEIDWTIADLVADVRAPTPSAAAEMVIVEKEKISQSVALSAERINQAIRNIISFCESDLESLISRYVFRKPQSLILEARQHIDELLRQLLSNTE
ncbi:MAG: exodeoxyribonuclease VII large subunit, partial [Candidatus Omnitrophica bacterium]|nr:exodeoxyribonuclease VII large subunit [Candidatus Omnitrophota bacterium]